MQITHDIDDRDFHYPENLPVKDVHVFIHPSGMLMTHDYSCPVCRDNHAVISGGLMQPCWDCQQDGYALIKIDKRPLWKQIFGVK